MGLLDDIWDTVKSKAKSVAAYAVNWWYGIKKLEGRDADTIGKLFNNMDKQKTQEAMRNQLFENIFTVYEESDVEELAHLNQIFVENQETFPQLLNKKNPYINLKESKKVISTISKILAEALVIKTNTKNAKLKKEKLKEKIKGLLEDVELIPIKQKLKF